SEPQYSRLVRVTSGKSHNLKWFRGHQTTGYCGRAEIKSFMAHPKLQFPSHLKSTVLSTWSLTRSLASDNSITEDAPVGNESTSSLEQAERVDHQLVRGIGIPALTANIVSSTIGAGIFVIPATVAKGLGSAAPLAFVCCAIAMVLFVTCFAIAGSRVSLTGG